MKPFEKHVGYAIAAAGCAAVLLCRMLFGGVLLDRAPLFPFLLAVAAAAWWGGRGPGTLATVLGALLGIYFVIPPSGSLRIDHLADAFSAGIFVFVGVIISHVCGALHQARSDSARQQFRILTDSIAQLVWTADPQGDVIWFNRRWRDYTGATPHELEHGGWQRFCDPSELPRLSQSWRVSLAAGQSWESTYRLRRKDGAMRWHLARAVPIRDESGQIMRWCGTSTDIDDRVAAERALETANASKDLYIATLAHELRNPLSAISSALQLWQRAPDDADELLRIHAIMSRQVKQLVRLVDDLLDMARISSGKIVLRRAPLDVAAVIAAAVETVQPTVAAVGHELNVTIGDEPLYVDGDQARLRQVLVNVLQNAAKYTPPRGAIWVRAEKRADQVLISVRDNGVGLPKHQLAAIFEAFHQVESSLGCSQGGLGIGLTLCRQLMALHGGAIEARSEGPGSGSEFAISLPALAAPPTADLAPHDDGQRPVISRRVLVVDDVRDTAENLAKTLRILGHEATPLFDGNRVVEWSLEHRPHVVLLDIGMPDLDGYEVARRLRRHPELSATVLVALTGFGQPDDRRRAAEAGFDFHITKPVDVDRLQELLWQVEDGHRPVTEEAVSCSTEAHIVFTDEEARSLWHTRF